MDVETTHSIDNVDLDQLRFAASSERFETIRKLFFREGKGVEKGYPAVRGESSSVVVEGRRRRAGGSC